MVGFTKLHETILDSSIWSEPLHVRIVWITMLAMADADGVVHASVSGLARRAGVSRDEADSALQVFLSPDDDSRDGTTGERIEKVPGGWLILNHGNYRETQTRQQKLTAERVRRHRERRKADSVTDDDVTLGNARKRAPASASASASVTEKNAQPKKAATRPDDVDEDTWSDWLDIRKRHRAHLTQRAWDAIDKEITAAGWTRQQAVTECIARGWRAFKAEWVQKPGAKKSITNMNPHAVSSGSLEAARRKDAMAAARDHDPRIAGLTERLEDKMMGDDDDA